MPLASQPQMPRGDFGVMRQGPIVQMRQQMPSSPNLQWGVWFFTRCCQVSAPTFFAVSSKASVAASICSIVIKVLFISIRASSSQRLFGETNASRVSLRSGGMAFCGATLPQKCFRTTRVLTRRKNPIMDTIILSNVNNKVNAITRWGAYLTTEIAGKISQFEHILSAENACGAPGTCTK